MAMKQLSGFAEQVNGKINSKNQEPKEQNRTIEKQIENEQFNTSKQGRGVVNELDVTDEELKRIQALVKKKKRNKQKSIKMDEYVESWLANVKEEKKQQGEIRPCIDDLMYDAIVEYLGNHYEHLKP